jgi:hypothetical protein
MHLREEEALRPVSISLGSSAGRDRGCLTLTFRELWCVAAVSDAV